MPPPPPAPTASAAASRRRRSPRAAVNAGLGGFAGIASRPAPRAAAVRRVSRNPASMPISPRQVARAQCRGDGRGSACRAAGEARRHLRAAFRQACRRTGRASARCRHERCLHGRRKFRRAGMIGACMGNGMADASMGDASMDADLGFDPALAAQALPGEQPPGPRRIPSIVTIGWLVLALVVASVIGTLVLAPSAVMSVLPGAARLYALFGAPVGAHGLAFEGVRYGWTSEGGQTVLEVQGDVVNLTAAPGRRADRGDRAPRREAARKSPNGPPRSARRSSRAGSMRRSCGRSRRRRAMSAASRCVSPRPSSMAQAAAAETVTPLYSAERIAERVEALGREIAASSPRRSRHRRDPEGQLHLRRRPHQGAPPRGAQARDRLYLPRELRRGHDVGRRGQECCATWRPSLRGGTW